MSEFKYIVISAFTALVLVLFSPLFYSRSESPEIREISPNEFFRDIDEFGDPEFSRYARKVINVQCPFYQPSGAVYRDCLLNLLEKESHGGDTKYVAEVRAECEAEVEKVFEEPSLVAGEMTLSCIVFKPASWSR